MNQPYKKQLKPYLLIGIISGFLIYWVSNWIFLSPTMENMGIYEKIDYFFTNEGFTFFLKQSVEYLFKYNHYSLLAGLTTFLICLMIYSYGNDKGIYRLGEEYGSARFATTDEMKKYEDSIEENNMILTQNAKMGMWNNRINRAFQKNKNVAIIGDSGSGKTFNFVKPNLLQCIGSIIVTDPKGLLVRETGTLLEKQGYKIKIFDLNALENSDQFNVFNYIKREIDLDKVLEAITEGTKKSNKQGDDFWIQAEAILARALLAFLWIDGKDNDYVPKLSMITDMLRIATPPNKETAAPISSSFAPISLWFEEQNKKHPNNYAYRQWKLFEESFEGETRASVLAIAASRYSVFDHYDVSNMVARDTMNIEKWIEEKTAVFITIPETNSAYNFLASIFITTIMETLRGRIDKILSGEEKLENGKNPLYIQFIIDEFFNIGRIPNIDKALATFRSRNMSIIIILQALAQLKSMYKNDWASILNNCASLLFLGGDEKETTKYLSERAGKQTINIRNHSFSRGNRGNSTENKQTLARDLMTPDEIGRLDGNQCLLFITKEYVYKDYKYNVYDHSLANLLASDYTDLKWYKYRRFMSEVDELMDNVKKEDVIDKGIIGEDVDYDLFKYTEEDFDVL